MKNPVYYICIIFALFLLIDVPMIMYINASMYQGQFDRVNLGRGATNVLGSGIIAYLLLAFAVFWFTRESTTPAQAAINGAILGLSVYGIYDATNMATIAGWGIKESIVDTVWGTALCSGIAAGAHLLV